MSGLSLSLGIGVALILATATSVLAGALTPLVGAGAVFQLLVPGISLCYLMYLLRSAETGTGKVTALTFWGVLAVGAWWVAPPLTYYVLVHVAAIWLVRSLYFQSGLLPALLDLGLSAVAVCAFAWAAASTGSVFIATWFFFLVQAFFIVVPAASGDRTTHDAISGNESFERARRQADEALRILTRRS